MKVGDLVHCKYVSNKPLGLIIKVRTHRHAVWFDVLVNGHIWPFRPTTVEPLSK